MCGFYARFFKEEVSKAWETFDCVFEEFDSKTQAELKKVDAPVHQGKRLNESDYIWRILEVKYLKEREERLSILERRAYEPHSYMIYQNRKVNHGEHIPMNVHWGFFEKTYFPLQRIYIG